MKITHKCGATWSGTIVEHCAACHLTFGSTRAGDAHRTGAHGVAEGWDRRRCLTVEEMQAKTVERGRLKGERWFATRVNKYGTEIWGVNQARDTRWDVPGDESPGLAAVPSPPGRVDPQNADLAFLGKAA